MRVANIVFPVPGLLSLSLLRVEKTSLNRFFLRALRLKARLCSFSCEWCYLNMVTILSLTPPLR